LSRRYLVCPTARVRRECFGLLFYDTRSAQLTYVASGESIATVEGAEPGTRELVLVDEGPARQQSLMRLLERLSAKGMIEAVDRAQR
jgi:putative mycofactocin binding protein MftB